MYLANVRNIFPPELAESIESGIRAMGKKIKDFDHDDVILSGVESRTSSPVKIFRKEDFTSSFPWIYPCGEGAGYAGGIYLCGYGRHESCGSDYKNLLCSR